MKVELYDLMGSDLTVVDAARVSFNKQSGWDVKCVRGHDACEQMYPVESCPYCEKTLLGGDTKLINYLAAHHHWLPFRHPTLMFRCKAPIFVARQAVKHQVGMSWSEVSRRYVDDEPEFYYPQTWRKRADNKKQGSTDEEIEMPCWAEEEYYTHVRHCIDLYNQLLEEQVAPEIARLVLPQAMYTEWMWTGSLLAFAHFVKQRTEEHAQKEIQDFAKLFIPTFEERFPVSWAALMEHYTF